MNKITVAVLFGGHSSEYEVSLKSAAAVIRHMDSKKYETIQIGITKDGMWYLYQGDVQYIEEDTWHQRECIPAVISPDRHVHGIVEMGEKVRLIHIDVAFPMIHGKNGEDGTLQGLLELAGIPIAGCTTLSSALCMDKKRAHDLVRQAGLQVPRSVVLSKEDQESILWAQVKALRFPLFVKPVKAGSSFGISKIDRKEFLSSAVHNAFQYDSEVIVEEGIEGFEVGCAILGNEELTIGQVDEIQLSQGFFDFTEKYTLESACIHMPARIDKETEALIKKTAAMIYKTLACRGMARVDMFLTPDGEIVFNEVNTIPGFTAHSRYPNMMKGIGMTFSEVIDCVIGLAVTA